MKINHVAWLIGASALGILGLIAIQYTWMHHSRELQEDLFKNRVNMALCATVEQIAQDENSSNAVRSCCAGGGCTPTIDTLPTVRTALSSAMAFYNIDQPYEVEISPKNENDANYSCSLQPVLSNDSLHLQLTFQDKDRYYTQQMSLMAAASAGIILFICLVFMLAVYYMLRQKKISDQNRDYFNQMTHEFRTPLTNIRLATNILARKEQELANNKYVQIIKNECDHLKHQVENVLFLNGLEKGDYRLQTTAVDLRQLAAEVTESMDLQIRERGAQVRIADAPTMAIAQADAFHVRNAFRNLIDNALKYAGPNPVVDIGFRNDANGGTHILFADNGNGLAPNLHKKVFRKYFRCKDAVDSGEKGFGIGLSYVKKIMDMHKGEILVADGPQQGACFDLYFPKSAR